MLLLLLVLRYSAVKGALHAAVTVSVTVFCIREEQEKKRRIDRKVTRLRRFELARIKCHYTTP